MKEEGQVDRIVRLFTMRGIAYIIMLLGNTCSLYLVGRFKTRYPQPKRISDFYLIFKNVRTPIEEFVLILKEQFPDLEIK